MKIFDKLALGPKKNNASIEAESNYEMSTEAEREKTAFENYQRAKIARQPYEERWKENHEYYNNIHYSSKQLEAFINEQGWDMLPPISPDPFIQVETLIDVDIPSFEFKANDHRMSEEQALAREQAVQEVWDNNPMSEMNIENERSLGIIGTAFFKLSWDEQKQNGAFKGGIVVSNPDSSNIFPDPAARCMDDCEFCIHRYRMHINKARRVFPKAKGFWNQVRIDNEHSETEIYNDNEYAITDDDTVSIIEYYFRDTEGDIALCVFISVAGGFREVKYVKKFWKRTRFSGNKSYPIIRVRRVMIRQQFWGKGEIDFIKELVDAADRELAMAVMNDMMMGNDIVLADEDCWAEGFEPSTTPGAIWYKKPEKSVQRLGGVSYNGNEIAMIEYIHEKIQETNGNFNSQMGKEPMRVTASSGIYQLNERADKRANIKTYDRMNGYLALAKMTDWMVLEFYDDNRMVKVAGDKGDNSPDTFVKFNPTEQAVNNSESPVLPEDMEKDDALADNPEGEVVDEVETESSELYFPQIDVSVRIGTPMERSKAFTLAMTKDLSQLQVTPQNAEIVKSLIELLELPNGAKIKESIDKQMGFINNIEAQKVAPAAPATAQPQVQATPTSAEGGELETAIANLIDVLPPQVLEVIDQMDDERQVLILTRMVKMTPSELEAFVKQMVGGKANA